MKTKRPIRPKGPLRPTPELVLELRNEAAANSLCGSEEWTALLNEAADRLVTLTRSSYERRPKQEKTARRLSAAPSGQWRRLDRCQNIALLSQGCQTEA